MALLSNPFISNYLILGRRIYAKPTPGSLSYRNYGEFGRESGLHISRTNDMAQRAIASHSAKTVL